MGTQILRPQDCLVERITNPPADFFRRRSSGNYCNNYYYNNNHAATARSGRKRVTKPEQRKRVAPGYGQPVAAEHTLAMRRSSSDDSRVARTNHGFGLEKVKILRRGQSLDSAVKSDMYAGSAFAVSPSPSALPLPSFSMKKQVAAAVDDSATRDLRRLLRLE